MNEPAGMSTGEDMARWEALEAEARVRLDGEARESATQAPAGSPPADQPWDAQPQSWWEDAAATPPADEHSTAPTGAAEAEAPVAAQVKPEILLADADHAIGSSLEQAMLNRGWSVRRVTHGEVALAEFLRHPPHCFVFDFSLPGLGGLDLLRKLDEYGIADNTRMVANASQAPAIHVQRAKAAGVDRFLDRPRRSPDQIVDAVAGQLVEAGVVAADAQSPQVPTPEPVSTDPAPYTGGIFAESTAPSMPHPPPATAARPDDGGAYRSAFGTGGGPPGRVPKLD